MPTSRINIPVSSTSCLVCSPSIPASPKSHDAGGRRGRDLGGWKKKQTLFVFISFQTAAGCASHQLQRGTFWMLNQNINFKNSWKVHLEDLSHRSSISGEKKIYHQLNKKVTFLCVWLWKNSTGNPQWNKKKTPKKGPWQGPEKSWRTRGQRCFQWPLCGAHLRPTIFKKIKLTSRSTVGHGATLASQLRQGHPGVASVRTLKGEKKRQEALLDFPRPQSHHPPAYLAAAQNASMLAPMLCAGTATTSAPQAEGCW